MQLFLVFLLFWSLGLYFLHHLVLYVVTRILHWYQTAGAVCHDGKIETNTDPCIAAKRCKGESTKVQGKNFVLKTTLRCRNSTFLINNRMSLPNFQSHGKPSLVRKNYYIVLLSRHKSFSLVFSPFGSSTVLSTNLPTTFDMNTNPSIELEYEELPFAADISLVDFKYLDKSDLDDLCKEKKISIDLKGRVKRIWTELQENRKVK